MANREKGRKEFQWNAWNLFQMTSDATHTFQCNQSSLLICPKILSQGRDVTVLSALTCLAVNMALVRMEVKRKHWLASVKMAILEDTVTFVSRYFVLCENTFKKALFKKIASCTPNCRNGICISSNRCQCYEGWKGAGCDICVKHPGCVKGSCINPRGRVPVGDGCFCDSGFKGPLCDQLDCAPNDCVNGECQMLTENSAKIAECVCNTGWRGENCTECVAQPNDCRSGMCLDNVPWSCKAENSPGTTHDVLLPNFF